MANKILIALLLLSFFQACVPKDVSPKEYVHWVKDYAHGLHKKKEVGDFVFDVQYKPAEYVQVVEKGKEVLSPEGKKQVEELKKLQYYTLKIQLKDSKEDFLKVGAQSEQEVYQRLYYYSFAFQKDIALEAGGKSYPCQLFHFERSYDLTQSRTFVIAFDQSPAEEDKTLIIDSQDLGLGKVKIQFDNKDLSSVPTIKI